MIDDRRKLILAAGALTLANWRRGFAAESIEQPVAAGDDAFVARAFAMQQRAIDSGDQAYGAVVVRNGLVVGQAPSRVVVNADPTAHAEMEAIRDAARRQGRDGVRGCVLYSSSRPCPMCEAAAYWAGIERMIFGRDARDGGRPELC